MAPVLCLTFPPPHEPHRDVTYRRARLTPPVLRRSLPGGIRCHGRDAVLRLRWRIVLTDLAQRHDEHARRQRRPGNITISGFYQYGWYARDRPRNVAIVMGTYETPRVLATAQYLSATDNPFVAVDVDRRGLSFFGEGRQGPIGWAGVGGVDFVDPDGANDGDARRRYIFGGAHWTSAAGAALVFPGDRAWRISDPRDGLRHGMAASGFRRRPSPSIR